MFAYDKAGLLPGQDSNRSYVQEVFFNRFVPSDSFLGVLSKNRTQYRSVPKHTEYAGCSMGKYRDWSLIWEKA